MSPQAFVVVLLVVASLIIHQSPATFFPLLRRIPVQEKEKKGGGEEDERIFLQSRFESIPLGKKRKGNPDFTAFQGLISLFFFPMRNKCQRGW